MGEINPKDCDYFESSDDPTSIGNSLDSPTPWHGSVLGLADLQYVAARGRPRLIGLVGAQNAGKTTFLTSIYLKLFQGARVPGKTFAGSFSLRAWEELANNLRYPNETIPMFPRHTPNTEDRVPGLLHLAFRNQQDRVEDFLFTDAPGEWFSNWSQDRSGENARGARWIVHNSDTFLFFVDCADLAGEGIGTARNAITQLAQRLSDEVNGRQVLVLWSKVDIPVESDIRAQIMTRLDRFLPDARHFDITVHEDGLVGIQSVATEVLGNVQYQNPRIAVTKTSHGNNPFFAFRFK